MVENPGFLAGREVLVAETRHPQPPPQKRPRHQIVRIRLAAGRSHSEEGGTVRRRLAKRARRTEAFLIGRQRLHLALVDEVGIDQPDRLFGEGGFTAGIFAGDGRNAFTAIGRHEHQRSSLSRLRPAERRHQVGHFACQINHGCH